MIKGNKCRCDRCSYLWTPIKKPHQVRVCCRCKSYMWNTPRIRKRGESMWDKPKKKKTDNLDEFDDMLS